MNENQEIDIRMNQKIDIRALVEKLLQLDYLSLLLVENSVKVLTARQKLEQPPEPQKTA